MLYRLGPVSRFIRRGLNRAVPEGLSTITVAAGELAGARLSLDLRTEKDYWLGTYEVELQSAVADLVKPGMVAFDIGANIGYVTLLLSQAVGAEGQVFAFEALPANLERLSTNLKLNGLGARVNVVPGAVVDCSNPVQFLVGPSGGMGKADGSAGRQEVTYSQTIEVTGIGLDEFVYEEGNPVPQIVKMDIEGGEVLALPGMRRLLLEAQPILLLELHGPESSQAAWKNLKPAGYRLCQMTPGYPEVRTLDELDWKAYIVAIPAPAL
jgi:FkbM family methyltransferase